MLSLEDKKAIVADVAREASAAQSAIAAEYSGLTVEALTDLRRKARQSGVYLRVVKNTLARKAVSETEFACMQEGFVGPLILARVVASTGSYAPAFRVLGGAVVAVGVAAWFCPLPRPGGVALSGRAGKVGA